jgi:hypothetical protein
MRQWAASAAAYAFDVGRAGGKAHAAFDGMFWVRTYGVLVEVRKVFEEKVKTLTEVAAASSQSAGLGLHPAIVLHQSWARALVDAVASVQSQLSEDELVYLEYRRMVECHLHQEPYDYRRAGDGSVIDRRRSNILRRDLSLEATKAAIKRVLLAFNGEAAIACAFAERLSGPLADVAHLVDAYSTPDRRAFEAGPPARRGR